MKRSDDVESVVSEVYASMRAGDGEAVVRLIADGDDVLVIGTDADEWWDSAAAAKDAIRAQNDAVGGLDVQPGELHGYADGDIGWFDDRPSMRLPDGTLIPLRLTGVVTRSGKRWVVQQMHISVAATINDALFGQRGQKT